jgi:phosphatidylserine/phosphatidylglycerophosphate/cardiolipin synthase-like enzyme
MDKTMQRRFASLLLVLTQTLAVAAAKANSLTDVANQFKHPQFIQDNAMALKFRLALLDHAAPGAQVRIATYTYEFGTATTALNAHMCAATARGVKVELIADAKSGEVLGQENPYNADANVKKVEQEFANLANCGVQVFIHNYNTDFVTISLFNKRVPNIFGPNVKNGDSVNPVKADLRLKELRARLSDALHSTLEKNHLPNNPANVFSDIQQLVLNIAQLPSDNADGAESYIDMIGKNYRSILDDPFWSQFSQGNEAASVEKMKEINAAIVTALAKDPVLKDVRDKLRVYNRLNHRKLFIVQEPNGDSCAIVGGRNLGDSYLTNGPGTFRDGDVFFCSEQVPTLQKFMTEANASMDSLKTDLKDSAVNPPLKSVVRSIRATRKIKGRAVAAIAPNLLKAEDLGTIDQPMLLTSQWSSDGADDQIRLAMLKAIEREHKAIYIETAYAEFNKSMRDALQDALSKGVTVHIVTNGLFISDGGSKLIRLWMARWNDEMGAKYPHLFKIEYAPVSAGHMIHFKGAAFRCQEAVDKSFYREYIVGSHNFHPRSGYSDKENSIEWREATDTTCSDPASDLITLRAQYYQNQAKLAGGAVLRSYKSLYEELNEVTFRFEDYPNVNLARAIDRAMYLNGQLIEPQKLNWIQDLLDQGGLRDLIGILL